MALSYEAAVQLFRKGHFLELISGSGQSETERRALEPRHRVLVAHVLAITGHVEEAMILAQTVRDTADSPSISSQVERTLAVANWRHGNIATGLQHARTAVRFGDDSGDPEIRAWAYLHLFRLSIDSGTMDVIAALLLDVRRAVATAGRPEISAYLHNCVAILEGQTGRLAEARRHLDIAESLLQAAPNAWIAGSVALHRVTIAGINCEFDQCAEQLESIRKNAKRSGLQQHTTAAEASLAHVQFVRGQFERATNTAFDILRDDRVSILAKLGVADTLARVYLAQGEFDKCHDALRLIEIHVQEHPEVASAYHARWAAIPRARLLIKQGRPDEALKWLRTAEQKGHQLGDTPLEAVVQLLLAQILTGTGNLDDSASRLLRADRLGIVGVRDLQVQYYFASAVILKDFRPSLAEHLRRRASRLWATQGVMSARLEMDDEPATETGTESSLRAYGLSSAECVADSLAAFTDLAHQPRLLGEEMLLAIQGLDCSPSAKITESRANDEMREPANGTVVLPLGVDKKKQLTLVCAIPGDPVKAILLADVMRMGRHALELEKAREEERNRAALWPAPPAEEQAGALFIAEEMQTLLATARRIASTTVPVLITGETGTGKEVLARTIHAYSPRASETFLPFICNSVPRDMLDSQLFGHRKGSFTGATENFPGVIRAASGGTLFLDEIGEITPDVQPKLLRFLESNEVHPIGDVQPVRVDVRIIAATNADLDTLVAAGRFREDLFYRLNIVRLHVPPLRERRVEIPTLAQHYLQKHAQEYQKGNLRLAEETMEYLVLYRWPGNVRQLANEMRRLAALGEIDAVLMPEHLSAEIGASRRTIPASERTLDPTEMVVRIDQPMTAAVQHLERAMIQHAMRLTGGRMDETAAMLGLSRKGLYLKRVRYGLEPPEGAVEVA